MRAQSKVNDKIIYFKKPVFNVKTYQGFLFIIPWGYIAILLLPSFIFQCGFSADKQRYSF